MSTVIGSYCMRPYYADFRGIYKKGKAMPSYLIERYETEILDMLHQGMPQAEIVREFRSRGVNIPASSLSS